MRTNSRDGERGFRLNFQQAIKQIEAGQISHQYTLVGSETYLADELLASIEKALNSQQSVERNRFDLQENTIIEVLDEAEMFSFFSDLRLIIVDRADFLTSQPANKLTKQEEERLINYAESPNEQTVLIWLATGGKVDKRKKITKAFYKHTTVVELEQMNEQATKNHIIDELKARNISLPKDGLDELLERTDYQLGATMKEIEKLTTYQLTGKPVTKEVIEDLVPRSLESNVFELTDAVLNLNVSRATQIYQDLRLVGNDPVQLHALIISQFRLIIQTRILNQKGYGQDQIAKHLGVHPYRVKLALGRNRHINIDQLLIYYQKLAEVDLKLKTGVGPQDVHFYLLMTQLVDLVK